MRKSIVILLLIAICLPDVQGQLISRDQTFTVNAISGCHPFTIVVTRPDCENQSCALIWGDKPGQNTSFEGKKEISYLFPGPISNFDLKVAKGNGVPDGILINVYENTAPQFELFSCNGEQVFVRITDNGYDNYDVTFPSFPPVNLAQGGTHIQAGLPAGPHDVVVKGLRVNGNMDNCLTNTKTVNVVNALEPQNIDVLTVLDEKKIELDLSEPAPEQRTTPYKIRYGRNSNNPTSFTGNLFDVLNQGAVTIERSIQTDNNYYCFQLVPVNFCNLSSPSPASNMICSADFDVTAQDGSNTITWSTAGTNNFRIEKTPGMPLTPTSMPHIDTDVVCEPYSYYLVSDYGSGMSYSLTKTVTSFSTAIPPSIKNISTVVNEPGTEVSLTWEPVKDVEAYAIYRNPYTKPLANTTTEQFTDTGYQTGSPYCYRINYKNTCGIESPQSDEACPIRLTLDNINIDNTFDLSWNAYTGWAGGVNEYKLERVPEFPSQIILPNGTTTYTDLDAKINENQQTYEYRLIAYDAETGLRQSVSNKLIAIKEPNLYYPTAFTPDGSGQMINETFGVKGQFINNYLMKVYNRWGELLFATEDPGEGWDGKYKGSPAPEGPYVFITIIIDEAGRSFTRSGSVLLLRKK